MSLSKISSEDFGRESVWVALAQQFLIGEDGF
jgi:hypothetical protein